MRVYIPATYRAALMALKRGTDADIERTEEISRKHADIAKRIFDGLTQGTISEAHQRTPHSLTIYHRSTRHNGIIQCSHFYRMTPDSDYYAVSHTDITTPRDFNFSPRRYITITKGV